MRILTTQTLLPGGYGIPRYVSIEVHLFETKNTYYNVLYQSQREWNEGNHSIWPWVTYLVECSPTPTLLSSSGLRASGADRRN